MKAVRRYTDGETWGLEEVTVSVPRARAAAMAEYHNGKRVYHIGGRRFCIVQANYPSSGEIVFFTDVEWAYLKSQNLSPDQFSVIWALKKENYHYSPIPEEEITEARAFGVGVCKNVISMLAEGRKRREAQEVEENRLREARARVSLSKTTREDPSASNQEAEKK